MSNSKIRIESYSSVTDFLMDNQVYLESNELTNSRMLGLLMDEFKRDNTLLLSITENNLPICCAIKVLNGNLNIYGDEEKNSLTIPLIADYLYQHNIELSGLIGSNNQSIDFANKWQEYTGLEFSIKNQIRYQLTKVIPPVPRSGNFKKVSLEDNEILKQWLHEFRVEALHLDKKEGVPALAQSKIQKEEIYFWQENETLVSMAGIARPTSNGITINYVYTPKEYRKNGYASKLVAEVSRLLLKKYRFCTLVTNAYNSTSNKIYSNIGYIENSRFKRIKFNHPN